MQIVFWYWWVLAFALLIAEIILPSTFCLWLGLAALGTGVIDWCVPNLPLPVEVVIFSVLSVIAVLAWFRFRRREDPHADNGLNQRGRNYVGQVFELVEPISHGFGKARVEDTVWRVAGPDLAAGSKVRVTAVEGATLQVEIAA